MDFNIFNFLLSLVPLILAISIHEAAHALSAYKCGDDTAFLLGRVTLSPSKHIDPLGTIILPLVLWALSKGTFTFGWAKPVPVNYLKLKHIRTDPFFIAAAGPMSNIIQAIIWALIYALTAKFFGYPSQDERTLSEGLIIMSISGVWINILLAVFNLIPIPPLDGSKMLMIMLPDHLSDKLHQIGQYGFFIIIFLSYTDILPIRKITFFLSNHLFTFLENILL